jgi:hypothetical protein
VDPDAITLGGLHGGQHVLVARQQHRVGDRTMPGQRLQVGAELGVHALLLALGVEVAEPQLHQGQVGDDALVHRGLPARRRVEPVHPQELAAELFVGAVGQRPDELLRGDPVLPAGAGVEQQGARGRVEIARVDEDGIAGRLW